MKTDKILHLLFGFIIAWRLIDINAHWIIALVVVILFGVAKEVYDYKSYGLFDWRDLMATISGAIILILTDI
jgi:hypothetical protein